MESRSNAGFSFVLLSPQCLRVACVLDSTGQPCFFCTRSQTYSIAEAVSRPGAVTTRSTAAAVTGTPPPPRGRASSAKSSKSSIIGEKAERTNSKENKRDARSIEDLFFSEFHHRWGWGYTKGNQKSSLGGVSRVPIIGKRLNVLRQTEGFSLEYVQEFDHG